MTSAKVLDGLGGYARLMVESRDAEIVQLRTALKDCADELADQIEGHYAATKDHPAMKRRYDRDMQPVIAARKLLEGCL